MWYIILSLIGFGFICKEFWITRKEKFNFPLFLVGSVQKPIEIILSPLINFLKNIGKNIYPIIINEVISNLLFL